MNIKRLSLKTHDLEGQFEFYQNVLELPVAKFEDSISVQIGSTELIFNEDKTGHLSTYHFAMNIPENKISEALDWLKERVSLLSDEEGTHIFNFENWKAHALYTYDAAGNIIEFIARHELINSSGDEFSAKSLLNVSEIGIATDDVVALAQQFKEEFDLEVYNGDVDKSFTPMGDAHGLFILVEEGREWFPETEIPAEALETEVDFEDSEGRPFSFSM